MYKGVDTAVSTPLQDMLRLTQCGQTHTEMDRITEQWGDEEDVLVVAGTKGHWSTTAAWLDAFSLTWDELHPAGANEELLFRYIFNLNTINTQAHNNTQVILDEAAVTN